jgi:hypothetical protein
MVSRERSDTLGISSWRTSESDEADRAGDRLGGGATRLVAAEGAVEEDDVPRAPGVAGADEFAAVGAAPPEPSGESAAVSPGAEATGGAVVDATSVVGARELDCPLNQRTPTQPSATATTTATIGTTTDFRSVGGSDTGSELNTARMTSRVEPSLADGFATAAAAVAEPAAVGGVTTAGSVVPRLSQSWNSATLGRCAGLRDRQRRTISMKATGKSVGSATLSPRSPDLEGARCVNAWQRVTPSAHMSPEVEKLPSRASGGL